MSVHVAGPTYDYLLLVSQWGITLCNDGTFPCTTNLTETTLHGLWPSVLNKKTYPCAIRCAAQSRSRGELCCARRSLRPPPSPPSPRLPRHSCDCDPNQPFNPSLLNSTLLAEMAQFWPSLSNGGNDAFWQHEWSKHGTCALDVLPSQPDFFASSLALRAKYDIVAALGKAGYAPSNTEGFTLAQLNAALAAAYGGDVLARVSCDANGFIRELSLCFDKQFMPLQCPIASAPGACAQASTRTLYLPVTK